MKSLKKSVIFILVFLLVFTSIQAPCIGSEIAPVGSLGGSAQESTASAIAPEGGTQEAAPSSALPGESQPSAGAASEGFSDTTDAGAAYVSGSMTDSPNMILTYVLAADGVSYVVTASLSDSNSNPVQGMTVYFTTDFGILDQQTAVTDDSGKASVTVSSDVSGTAVVEAEFFDNSGWKTDSIEITFSPAVEDPDLKADCEWLTADLLFGSNGYIAYESGTDLFYIINCDTTSKLDLPGNGPNGSTISWASSDMGAVAPDGTVTGPANGQDIGVLLTAVLSKGENKTSEIFNICINRLNQSTDDEKAICRDYYWLAEYFASLGSVDGSISLPSIGANGSAISWISSSNPAVVDTDGTVTRPTYAQYFADGQHYTLTAVLSKGDAAKITRSCMVQVVPLDKTDDDTVVSNDYSWLDESVLTLGGDQFNLSCVTWNLYLPKAGPNGSAIFWESSDPGTITTSGAITRPSYAEGNRIVNLTAEISKGIITVRKSFNATVLPILTAEERVALDKEWLTSAVILNGNSADDVKTNLSLPPIGQKLPYDNKRSAISWESSDTGAVSTEGKVTRPGITEGDKAVTLTATISCEGFTGQKSFDVTVTKKEKLPVALKYEDFSDTDGRLQFNGISSTAYTTDESGNNIKALQFINDAPSSGGSVFTANRLHLEEDMSFSAAFAFKSAHSDYILGESGFTFVLQAGDNKAYNQNEIKPSLSIKINRSFRSFQGSGQATGYDFDDYIEVFYNGNNDASADNGRMVNTGGGLTNTADNARYIWIDYDGQAKNLKIRYSYTPERPDYIALELDNTDLGQIMTGAASTTAAGIEAVEDVYAGFTGSFGNAKDNIEIYKWYFKNGSVPINPQIYSFIDASVTLSANPPGGQAFSILTASVNGKDGPVTGLPILFSTDFGTLDAPSKITDASGNASVLLSTTAAGAAFVKTIAAGGSMSTAEVVLAITDADVINFDKAWLTDEIVLNGNSALNNIAKDLYLPVLGASGSTISWTSSNTDVVSVDGKVTRPSLVQGDQAVTLTAVLSKFSEGTGKTEKTEKTFIVTVKVRDADIAAADGDWLTDELILNGNSALDNITGNLYLPQNGPNGSNISWASGNTAVAVPDGTVTRPSYTQGDRTVTLTATIRKDSAEVTKSFNITVRKLAPDDKEAVALDYAWLTDALVLDGNSDLYTVTKNLKLPVLGPNGTTIGWTSSNEAFAAPDGTVTQPSFAQKDQLVELTAAISRGSEKTEKVFTIIVKSKATDKEAVDLDYKWLDIDMVLNGNSKWSDVIKDLKLPVLGPNGTEIRWSSTREDVIATDGKVNRLRWSVGSVYVTLTAVISKDGESLQKEFLLEVTRLDQTDQEAVDADKIWLGFYTLGLNLSANSITMDLSLPATARYGSSVVWTSDTPGVISDNGAVTRPEYYEGHKRVTLTAALSKGDVKAEETFSYYVLAKPDIYSPKVTGTTPENNSDDILWNTREITVTFDENIKRGSLTGTAGVNSFGIYLQNSVERQISATIDRNRLIITLNNDPPAGENTLIFPEGAVTDPLGNHSEAFGLSFSVEQKQNNKIEVISSNPADMAKQIDPNSQISFSYNYTEIFKGNAFSGISMCTGDGRAVSAEPVLNGTVVTLNLHAALKAGTVYELSIPSGAVQDRFENSSSEKIIRFRTRLSDKEPEVISAYPIDGRKNVDIRENIEIKFSDVVKAKNCELVLKDQKGNLIKTFVKSSNAMQTGVILEPCGPLEPKTEYTLTGPYLSAEDPSKLVFSTSFTTGANALGRSKVSPVTGGSYFASVYTPIEIEFGASVTRVPKFTKISISDSEGNPVTFSAHETSNTAVLTPSSELAQSETYTVTIPEGAYQNAEGGFNDAFKFEFTTAAQLEPDLFVANPSTVWLVNKPMKFSIAGITSKFSRSGYQITSCAWDFGDGQTGTENNPSHIYTETGDYTVTLRLKDDKGFSYELERTVTIGNIDPNDLRMSVSSDGSDHIIIRSGDNSSSNKPYRVQLQYNGGFVSGETIRVKLYKNGAFQKDFGTVTAGGSDSAYIFPFYYAGQGYLGAYELVFECEGLLKGKVVRKPVTVDESMCMGSLRIKLMDYNEGEYIDDPTWNFTIDGGKKVGVREWYNEEDGYCYIIKDIELSRRHKIIPWFFTVDTRYYRTDNIFLPYTDACLLTYEGRKIGPGVNSVNLDFTDKGRFSFIEGVDTGVVSFTVNGDWKDMRSGYYEMKTDSGRLNIKSSRPVIKFNAGTELRAGESLYARMVSHDGISSSWQRVNVEVLPKPSLSFGPDLSIRFENGEYHISMPMGISSIIGEGIPLLENIPLLNKSESFGLGKDKPVLDGKMEDGWIYLDFGGGFGYKTTTEKEEKQKKKVKITTVGYEIDVDMQGELGLMYDDNARIWKMRYGEFELFGFVDKQWGRKYTLPKVNIGIGATLDLGTYVGGVLIVDKTNGSNGDYKGIISIEPIVAVTVQAGPDWLNISFNVTGYIPAEVHFPTGYIGANIGATATISATCLMWSKDLLDEELFNVHWDNGKEKVKSAMLSAAAQSPATAQLDSEALPAAAASSAAAADTGNAGFEPMPRDYLARQSQMPSSMKSMASSYASMTIAASSEESAAAAANPDIKTIKENIFPEAGVQLVRNGDELWTIWTDDNPERSSMNRTQMRYSILKDGTQSEPVWVGQDGTADFDPAAAAADGGVLMAWQNIKQPMNEDVDIATYAKCAEISVTEGVCDAGGSEPGIVTLTDDDKYDHSPKLAADGKNALLVWTKSEGLGLNMGDDSEELQSPENSDGLFFSRWDGNAWSTPAEIEGSLPIVLNSSLIMHGSGELLLYTLDMDNNLATDGDREIFARSYGDNKWGDAMRLTDNQVPDSDPKAVWCNGQWFITWYRDGNIMYKTGLGEEARTEELLNKVEGGYGLALKQGENPQAALIYGSAGDNNVRNLSAAFYDVGNGVWSDRIPLTDGEDRIQKISPVFTGDNVLDIAYTQAEIITEAKNGAEYKNVSDKVDLHILTYTPVHDLALTKEDALQLSDEFPLPGTVETVTATVRNQGDFAEKAAVYLYDGNPAEGGVIIGEAVIAQPVPARSSAEVNIDWLVGSEERAEYDLYAVVQSDAGVTETDTSNNTISCKFTTADIAVTGLKCDNTGKDNYLVKVTVANRGSKTLDDVKIRFEQSQDGAVVETDDLGRLWPGEEEEFSFILSSKGLLKDESGKSDMLARALPTEDVIENSTDNNTYEFALEPASITVDSSDPIRGEEQAGIDKPIVIRFSMDAEAGAGFEKISLADEELNKIGINKKLENGTLTVTPKSALAYGTQYILTIPADALGDSYGHAMKGAFNLVFTTVASSPEVTFAYPANGTDQIAADEEIRMLYNQEILVGPGYKNITMTGPGSKKIAASASLNGKWLYIRPASVLGNNRQYSLNIPRGAVENDKGELQQEDFELTFTTAGADEPEQPENPGTDNPGTDNPGTDNPGIDNPGEEDTGESAGGAAAGQPAYRLSRQTSKDGVSTVTVNIDEQTVESLKIENSFAVLDISGEVKNDGLIQVNLSESVLKRLAAMNLGLSAISGKGNVSLPADLIKALIAAAEKNSGENTVTITIAENKKKLNDSGRVSAGIFDFSVMAGGKPVTEFKPEVIVTIPMDASKVVNAKRVIACIYNEASKSWQPVGGTADTEAGTVTFGARHFSTYAAFETVRRFDDVKEGWAKEKVEILASRGLISGITDKIFNPEGRITRAEFAALIVRSLYTGLSKYKGAFADVAGNKWYADEVETAYELGIVSGTVAKRFEPDEGISREQLAVIAYRLYQYKTGKKAAGSFANTFTDQLDISSYAKDAVEFVAGTGIMEGSDGRFSPRRGATRQEAAVVLYRLLEYMGEL